MTYGQVAAELGAPSAARAVGYALGALSSDTHIPWWRVINAKGGVSLRQRGAEADLQRELLEGEGLRFGHSDTIKLQDYRWWPDDEGT